MATAAALALFAFCAVTLLSQQKTASQTKTGLQIPEPLVHEHEEIHGELLKVLQLGGQTAVAGRKVANLLHSHFEKEEQFAMPPLGLLAPLAHGNRVKDPKAVLKLTDKLKAGLPTMLAEHKSVVAALDELVKAATEEKQPSATAFAQKLKAHAATEEEVLYPAAILVGDVVRLRQRW